MTVRIAAQFTKDTRVRNGLIPAAADIAKDRHEWRGIAVVRLDCVRVTDEIEDGLEIPTVGIRHIEVLDGDAAETAERLLNQAYEARTGNTPIPGVDGQGDTDGWDEGPVSQRPADEWLDDKAKA